MAILLDNKTTGTGTAINTGSIGHEHCFYVEWAADVTAGVVSLETARTQGYTGTWAVIDTESFEAGATNVFSYAGALLAVRARITTTVAGGSDPGVTVEYVHSGD